MNTRMGRTKQARAKKVGESVSYRVCIVGNTWAGYTSTYDYTFDHEPTAQEVTSRAGDFQLVNDYETMKVTTIQYTDGHRRIVKIVKPWDSQESCDIACELHGC